LEPPLKEDVQYINFQVFPASYTLESGETFGNEYKVIATNEWLIVYSDKNVVQSVMKLESFEKLSYKEYTVQTDVGSIVVRREDNCGCGNQLRGFHPYQGIPYIAHYPYLKGT